MKTIFRIMILAVLTISAFAVLQKYGASNALSRLVELFHPTDAVTRGGEEMQKAHFDQAEVAFSQAVQSHPHDADAAYSLGWSLQAQGKDDEALKAYAHASELAMHDKLYSTIEMASQNSGAIYMKRKQYAKAENSYRAALKINPLSADSAFQLGMTLMARKKRVEARSLFEEALKLNPKYLAASHQLRAMAMNGGDDDHPIAAMKKKSRTPTSSPKKKQAARRT